MRVAFSRKKFRPLYTFDVSVQYYAALDLLKTLKALGANIANEAYASDKFSVGKLLSARLALPQDRMLHVR